MNTGDDKALPPWIERHERRGEKIVFLWTKAERSRHPRFDPAQFALFPAVVIAGTVYATVGACLALDTYGYIGETDFFPDWEAAIAWLNDPQAPWKRPCFEEDEDYAWTLDDEPDPAMMPLRIPLLEL